MQKEIQKIVSRYFGEWNDTTYPGMISYRIPHTALLGNGDVGIVSGGDANSKQFFISKSDFWTYGTGNYEEPCPPILIGGLIVRSAKCAQEQAAQEPFREVQDIFKAEIQTLQQIARVSVSMKTWLASEQNILVIELKSNGKEDAKIEVELWASAHDTEKKPVTAQDDGTSITVTRSTENKSPQEPKAHTSKAALAAKIIGAETISCFSDNPAGKGTLQFTLKAGAIVYLVTAVGGGGRTLHSNGSPWECTVEPTKEANTLLQKVKRHTDIIQLYQERKAWWKNFWSASYIDLGVEDEQLNLIQRYYYGAQYLLGSATKPGKTAPGLFGIWHTDDKENIKSWSSDYHLNYNFMSTFYGTGSSNRPELSRAGIQALLDYLPEGRKRASSIEQLRRINADFVQKKIAKGDISEKFGIPNAVLFPVGIGPWGMTMDDHYLNEALNAAYNVYLMTEYYAYTKDKTFLKDDVYDYMKQAAAFYEAWLEKEQSVSAKDGYTYVLYAGYSEGTWAKNPAVELATLKHLLRNLVLYSEELEKDEEKRMLWIDIYTHLAEAPITISNEKKVLALGEKQMLDEQWKSLPSPIPEDGNALPLDAVIPGGVYHYFSSKEELQLLQDTIDVFSENGAWTQINNFPRLFPDAVEVRYPVEKVVEKLVSVIKQQLQANLTIDDRVHGMEKVGATEAINRMLLLTSAGVTKIFPNWYPDKDAKFVRLRTKGAFLVSAEYDGSAQEVKDVAIISEAGENMTLVSPWKEGMTVKDSKGNVVETTKGTVPNWEDVENATYTFATVSGESYTVTKV